MSCIGIEDGPAWRFDGYISAENTSAPLLIIGNMHDTVTPPKNTDRVSTLFPKSVVFQEGSVGHGSHTVPSSCTAGYVREYFPTGTLSAIEIACRPHWVPFIGNVKWSGLAKSNGDSDDERELQEALALKATRHTGRWV
ncbi:hypothetical protein F5Y16DRAFT_101342 [Xylariaceae sp. FL0255]|nr:hypothetical protein F5Y16DRAFT_101342 [Xylariaceae sp. FL0255]